MIRSIFLSLVLVLGLAISAEAYTFTITWTDTNTVEEGYRVEERDDLGVYQPVVTVGPDVTTATHECMESQCCYQVVAFHSELPDSLPSNAICVNVPSLSKPTGVSVN
jgi:hypothetical protein